MRELRLVLETARQTAARGEEAVLATVMKVNGSTYRRPGACLLLTRDGRWVGGISGGCLEGDLARKAWWRTANGPGLARYDSSADDETAWRFGLGCNGVVHVLLERLSPARPDPLAFIRRCLDSGRAGVCATVIRADASTGGAVGDRLYVSADGRPEPAPSWGEFAAAVRADAAAFLADDHGGAMTYPVGGGEAEVVFLVIRPPVRLVVFGAGFDAVPVVAAATALGWSATVVDRRPGAGGRGAFAAADEVIAIPSGESLDRVCLDGRTAAVVMNHNFQDDRAALEVLLRSSVHYIGVLGPRARTEKMLAEIPGLPPDRLRNLYAPVGLDVGADTPEEIAAAVVAQVIAVLADRDGGHLRDRSGPIHRREPASNQDRHGVDGPPAVLGAMS